MYDGNLRAGDDAVADVFDALEARGRWDNTVVLVTSDHGDGFMTLYGHNESLLHEAGEWVSAGEAISVVGSNPGSTQGAYFEIRRNGKAVDPAAWLAR